MNAPHAATRWLTLAVLASLMTAPVLAQGVYRIVGPDGRVSFSDQPPPSTAPQRLSSGTASATPSASAAAQLPYELRQVSSRFPVTLYTSSDCAPCNSGRNLLNARGVPYIEKTVETPQDGLALKRVSGDTTLPFLTIGGQQIKGYADGEWTQFLDVAGYPKQSVLPSGFRRPAATPLVPVTNTNTDSGTGAAAPANTPPAPAQVPVAPAPQNPAGIRF